MRSSGAPGATTQAPGQRALQGALTLIPSGGQTYNVSPSRAIINGPL